MWNIRSCAVGLMMAASSLLAGASPVGAQAITIWHQGPAAEREFMTFVVAEFEKANPGARIKLEVFPNEAYKQQIQIGLQSSTPPDLFYNWPGERTAQLVRAGLVADLTDYGKRPGWWNERLSEGQLDAYRVGGRTYGVPYEASGYHMYYNKALYAQLGIAVPASFDDFLGMCREIRRKAPSIAPIALGNSERWMADHLVATFNQRIVGEERTGRDYALQGNPEELFGDPGYLKALETLIAMRDAGCFNNGVNATSPEVARALFHSGRAATIHCGTFCLADIRKSPVGPNLGIYRIPPIAGGAGRQGSIKGTANGMLVSAASRNKDLAASFANFLTSDAIQAEYNRRLARAPANMRGVNLEGQPADFRAIFDDFRTAEGFPLSLDVIATSGVAQAYLDGLQELLNGTLAPQQLIERIRVRAREDFAKIRPAGQ